MIRSVLGGAAVAALLAGGAHCEVVDLQSNGFTMDQKIEIQATPDKVYAALIDPAHWWSSGHTFSGDAKNMTFDARPGGCWCETLPNGGGVLHMTVVYVAPGKVVRMRGALGPFQPTGMDGAITVTVDPAKGGSTMLEWSYSLGGYIWGGFGALPGQADGVLNQQVRRLKSFVETGSADPK
ncbi:MAG TPA: SRPBCC family protein [Rhizomicrobium sp.]|nr:SRPBCC family protein [Rhizomicrobium sp.]